MIGGVTPLVAAWLVERTADEVAPAFLIMGAAAVTMVTILFFRETYRAPFVNAGVPGLFADKVIESTYRAAL